MIRGNYSLAKEVRKNEQKNKQKIQLRQKHQNKLEQLSAIDPIRLYHQLDKLGKSKDLDQFQQKRLAKLRQDWAFIRKNKLHEEKLLHFLETRAQISEAREKEQRKLRGKSSVYFNPELNPLGKVPNPKDLSRDYGEFYNIVKPVKAFFEYEKDPLINQLQIKPPEGSPPKYYKSVQNTQRTTKNEAQIPEMPGKDIHRSTFPNYKNLDTDSDGNLCSDT